MHAYMCNLNNIKFKILRITEKESNYGAFLTIKAGYKAIYTE